jgi:hypothetical protein
MERANTGNAAMGNVDLEQLTPGLIQEFGLNPAESDLIRVKKIYFLILQVGQPMSVPIRQSQRVKHNQTSREMKVESRGPKGWQASLGFGMGRRLAWKVALDTRPSSLDRLRTEAKLNHNLK